MAPELPPRDCVELGCWNSGGSQFKVTLPLHTEQVQISRLSLAWTLGLWVIHRPMQQLFPFFRFLLIWGTPLFWSTWVWQGWWQACYRAFATRIQWGLPVLFTSFVPWVRKPVTGNHLLLYPSAKGHSDWYSFLLLINVITSWHSRSVLSHTRWEMEISMIST